MPLSRIYIGFTVAASIIFIIIVMIVCCCCKKKKAKQNESYLQKEQGLTTQSIQTQYSKEDVTQSNTNGVTNHNENESIEVITHDNNTTKSTPETQPSPQPEPDPPVEIESKSPEVQLINKPNLNPSDTTTQHTISYTTIINDTETKEDIKDIKHKDSNSTPTPISSNTPKAKERQSLKIRVTSNDGTHKVLNPLPSDNENSSPIPKFKAKSDSNHQYTGTTIINNDSRDSDSSPISNINEPINELKSQWNPKNANTSTHNAGVESTIDNLKPWNGPRSSIKMQHAETESFDAANFDIDEDIEEAHHGYNASVQIHHDVTPSEQLLSGVLLTPDALTVDTLPKHMLSDSVESLDPDFVLEAAYFENPELYSMSREPSYSNQSDGLPPMPNGVSIPIEHKQNNTLTVEFGRNNNGKRYSQQSNVSSHTTAQSMRVSNDMSFGSTQWSMPGISIDHTASMQMLKSIQMFGPQIQTNMNKNMPNSVQMTPMPNANNIMKSVQMEPMPNNIMKSVQMEPMPNNIMKSVQMEPMPNNIMKSVQMEPMPNAPTNIGKSIQYEAIPSNKEVSYNNNNIGKSVQMEAAPKIDSNDIGKSVQMAQQAQQAQSMGGEQFIMWQMHGRKLKNMKHEQLVKWLEGAGFDEDTLSHFKKYKIDGKKLWQNIRNASMFLYNVGVVRPTLRDAIVQNIYLELLPKTPGFDERHMSDFKNLKLIADGPISTVYKAQIKLVQKLKLRESIVIIKGYHFRADDVRVGKIIQILVHMVTNIKNSRFVSIHGFIRNMMEGGGKYNRPMFGIVMEYCDGGSIHSQFKNGRTNKYNLEYNIMDKIGFLLEIATGMKELHKLNILHRNLKSSNVLISNNDDIKLTDYCLDVTQLTDFTHSLDAKERSMRWMSPELIRTSNYTKACDIYSFGITCYEILSGMKPYHTYSNGHNDLLRMIITKNLRPSIDDLANLPEDLLILMTNCWNENISIRPQSFDEIERELSVIHDVLRNNCITFDDIYARARASMLQQQMTDEFGQKKKLYQSSPLLTIQDDDNSEIDEYEYDDYDIQQQIQNQMIEDFDDNSDDDIKFEQLLQPYNNTNRPTHVKDDTALELDKIKKFTPKRRKIHTNKKRPRKPLPKAPPVNKQLPSINNDIVQIKKTGKTIKIIDKPLPPKPLDE